MAQMQPEGITSSTAETEQGLAQEQVQTPKAQPEPEPEPVPVALMAAGRGQVESLDESPESEHAQHSVGSEPQPHPWMGIAVEAGPQPEPEPYSGPAAVDLEEDDVVVGRVQPPSSPHVVHVRADVLRERFTEIPSPFASPSSATTLGLDLDGHPSQGATDSDDEGGWIDHGETGIKGDAEPPGEDSAAFDSATPNDVHGLPAPGISSQSAEVYAADDGAAHAGLSCGEPGSQHPPSGKVSQGHDERPAPRAAEQIATPPQSPENQLAQPSTVQILGSIQNQQHEMQLLQATLANAASQQAERQHQLIEQQLAWYRQQQEQQQRQLEQVQQVSQRMLVTESELAQSKIQSLQAAQERLDIMVGQPIPAHAQQSLKPSFDDETRPQEAFDQTRMAPRSPTRPDIIDHAADEAHRTIRRMRRVVGSPDSKLPEGLGESNSIAGDKSPSKARVSFGVGSAEAGCSQLDTVPTSQLMLDMGKRVDRALAEASTVTTRSGQRAAMYISSAEREEAVAADVSDYYQRVRSLMQAVVGAAEIEGGQVSGDVPVKKSSDHASFDAVSMMPPSCWSVSAPAQYPSSEGEWLADATSVQLSLEVQRRISSVANGTSTVPLPTPKPKRRPKKQADPVVGRRAQAPQQPLAVSESATSRHTHLESGVQTSAASHKPPTTYSARNTARASSADHRRTVKRSRPVEQQARKPSVRESWLTIKRTPSVTAVFRRSSDEFMAHLANVEADWRAGLAASMVTGAKPDPRWVAARQADTAAVAAALSTRRTRRSIAPLDTASTAQATSLLGEYSLASTAGQTVVNLYGQQGRRDKPELHHLKSAMTKFLRQQKPKQVTLYKIGCELLSHSGDHLDWATQVRPVLEELGARYKCRLTVWEQEPAAKRTKKPTFGSSVEVVRSSAAGDRKAVGISVSTGRQTVRQSPQTYSEQATGPVRSSRQTSSKETARMLPHEGLGDKRSTGMQSLVESMADQIRTGLASAMPSKLERTGATDSAELLEQLAVKAIRTEVAKLLKRGADIQDIHQGDRTGGHGRRSTGHPRGGLDATSDSVTSEEEPDTGFVSPPADGDNFESVLKGLVMALLADPSRDLLEPLSYNEHSATSDPFPTAGETGPCLLSTGAAGAWSLTRATGQIVFDEDAVERKERMRLEKEARKKAAHTRKLAALKFFLRLLKKTKQNIFSAWADHVHGTKRLEERARALQEKWDKERRRTAFETIHGEWKQRKEWHAKIKKFMNYWMGKSLRGCFAAWAGHVDAEKRAAAEAENRKQEEAARKAAQEAAEEARQETARAERELAEQKEAELRRLKLEMENAEKERAAKLAADKQAKLQAEAEAEATALAAREAAMAMKELEAARLAAASAEAARISALEDQLSKANAARAAAAAAAAAAAEKDIGGKDVRVSINWGDLIEEIGPAGRPPLRRDQPPEELSPIRFAPSNAHDLRDDSDYSPRRRSYKSQARLLQSDSEYSDDDGWRPLPRSRERNSEGAARAAPRPGESSTSAAARRRREQRCALIMHTRCFHQVLRANQDKQLTNALVSECDRRPWQNPDPTYYDEWRVQKRDQFHGECSPFRPKPKASCLICGAAFAWILGAEQLKEERDLSGSEISLPSSHWDSADEDAGGPNPRLRAPLDLAAFDEATRPTGA